MKKINLKQTRVFTDSYREKYLLVDMSKGFMNAIYASLPSSSITRSLLQRIRESEGEIEITSAEESVLLSLVGGEKINGLPADALLFELNKGKFEESTECTNGDICVTVHGPDHDFRRHGWSD